MLSEIIDFKSCCKSDEIIDFLYEIFKNDFIDNSCYLANKIHINPQSNKKREGKEEIFWHVITRENHKTRKRKFDTDRACRIKWIKTIILNHNHSKIKMFYYLESSGKIRFYLWAYEADFIVILQKLGSTSSYLVTSFYIDKGYNKRIYSKRYEAYKNKKDARLNGCEWF